MSSIIPALTKVFPRIRRHGDFYATGTMEMFAPYLESMGLAIFLYFFSSCRSLFQVTATQPSRSA